MKAGQSTGLFPALRRRRPFCCGPAPEGELDAVGGLVAPRLFTSRLRGFVSQIRGSSP